MNVYKPCDCLLFHSTSATTELIRRSSVFWGNIINTVAHMLHFLLYAVPRYMVTLLFHKLVVLLMGLWINFRLRGTAFGVSLRHLVFHDWSKFSPAEFFP